jgi:hypothetical protein
VRRTTRILIKTGHRWPWAPRVACGLGGGVSDSGRPRPVVFAGLAAACLLLIPLIRWASAADAPRAESRPWIPVGRLDPTVVQEASGVVKSRRYPGIFWTHGDSGTPATLFAFKETGEVVAAVPLARSVNVDWEDIGADQSGHLYVGDIGNNFGLFPVRYVYIVPEPDPYQRPVRPVAWTKRIRYKYPDRRFNAEGLFVLDDEIYVVSIGLHRGRPTVYRLEPASETDYTLETVGPLPMYQARGADVSDDGKRLAVCTPSSLAVFDVATNGLVDADARPMRVTFPSCPAEACCFDGDDVILVTEAGWIYRISQADLRAGTRFVRPPKAKRSD